jgi:P27 family predicted phage terminase small subunit
VNPPKHLSRASKAFWKHVLEEYELDRPHLGVLQVALEAWDRKEQARQTLDSDGTTYKDRFGSPRKHPAVGIEENARIAFLRAMRELDLEGEPAPDPRPPRR